MIPVEKKIVSKIERTESKKPRKKKLTREQKCIERARAKTGIKQCINVKPGISWTYNPHTVHTAHGYPKKPLLTK